MKSNELNFFFCSEIKFEIFEEFLGFTDSYKRLRLLSKIRQC